jgi:type IV pilus assembly protein PilW
MQENGRFALDLITRDLRRAGYWGGNLDITRTMGAGSNPGPQAAAHACGNNDEWGRMVAWKVSGVDDTDIPDVINYDCVSGYVSGTDILTARYAESGSAPTPLSNNGIYLRTTFFQSRIITGATQGESGNSITPGGSDVDPQVRRIVSNAYYVGDTGRTCAGGGAMIPALFRVSLHPDNGTPQVNEVVPGVENLQVRYLLEGEYVDADAINDDDWPNIWAARVWLLMRSECPDTGITDPRTYTMGNVDVTPADRFWRQLYTTTVMLRNTR